MLLLIQQQDVCIEKQSEQSSIKPALQMFDQYACQCLYMESHSVCYSSGHWLQAIYAISSSIMGHWMYEMIVTLCTACWKCSGSLTLCNINRGTSNEKV